ncbi:MAG: pre-16S rRNA-processing nuclease YqgF [Asgard group archaeon]|nr:pre-16S rRNA-processing nuclease YqgF [Asgard group archaeon]
MLISLATMNFKLCYLLREKLTVGGFRVEQIVLGEKPSKGSVLVISTEEEAKGKKFDYKNFIALSNSEVLNVDKAYTKIILGIEGKRIWESLIVGVDPGLTIGVAIITDGCLRTTLETRDRKEMMDFILNTIDSNPAKMAIIRVGSTGGYRRVLILNELLNVKPKNVALEIVDELETTPATTQEAQDGINDGVKTGVKIKAGKDAAAAMEIAFRIGESVKSPETWQTSDGELKEIQVLSRQFSRGKVTVSKELAKKVASGLLTLEEAIEIQKSENK